LGEVKSILVQTKNRKEGRTNVQCKEKNDKYGQCGAMKQSREGKEIGTH